MIKILLSCPEGLTVMAQPENPTVHQKKLKFSRLKQLLNVAVNSKGYGRRPLISSVEPHV